MKANKAKIYEEIEASDAHGFHLPLSNPHFEIFALVKYYAFVLSLLENINCFPQKINAAKSFQLK